MLYWLKSKLLAHELLDAAHDYVLSRHARLMEERLQQALDEVRKGLEKAKASELEPLVAPIAQLLVQRHDVRVVASRALVAMGDRRRIARLRPTIEQIVKESRNTQSNMMDLCEHFSVLIKGLTDVENPTFLKELEHLISDAMWDVEFRKTHPTERRFSGSIRQEPGMGISHYEEPRAYED
jgi:hypothetical protein